MLGDQLESTELLANSFNTFLAGLTADFVPLPQIIPGSFFPVPEHLLVDTHMVYKALRGIKSNKSGGPDPIPGKVRKEFAFELSPVITNIYNASMVQGYVPVFLKQSEVVPVPKCSPPKVVEQDLRPISLTPHIAKVMEGLTLAPLLFAILVNNLCRDWRYRIKYVDDTSVFESIPRCSPGYLPFIAANINTYASMRNMRLNEKKCKDMVINFLKYQPTVITPIQLNGIVIDRVSSYKLLGVIISNDLSWNEHCDSIHKKATKRLFVLRTLKRVGLGTNDLVLVYCSIVRSIVEYASPVWAAIPLYLDELIESVQRKALKIIFGRVDYVEAWSWPAWSLLVTGEKELVSGLWLLHAKCPPLITSSPVLPLLSLTTV